jgi:hypothetical protein
MSQLQLLFDDDETFMKSKKVFQGFCRLKIHKIPLNQNFSPANSTQL